MLNIIRKDIVYGIIISLGIMMLFSCKNDINDVKKVIENIDYPTMIGDSVELIYSDSARIKYKVVTPKYIEYKRKDDNLQEFPSGLKIILYNTDRSIQGTFRSNYAKKIGKDNLWIARGDVVLVNNEGAKLETELLYWDMNKKLIYSDAYTRLTKDGEIIEGNDGFESDQDLKNPVIKNITGIVEIAKPK